MTIREAGSITNDQVNKFQFRNKGIRTFNEFKYFTSITSLPGGQGVTAYFYQDSTIKEISLPENLITMGGNFVAQSTLEKYIIGSKVTTLGFNGLTSTRYLRELYCYAEKAPGGSINFVHVGDAVSGPKYMFVPVGATGYNAGGWETAEANGWIVSYSL